MDHGSSALLWLHFDHISQLLQTSLGIKGLLPLKDTIAKCVFWILKRNEKSTAFSFCHGQGHTGTFRSDNSLLSRHTGLTLREWTWSGVHGVDTIDSLGSASISVTKRPQSNPNGPFRCCHHRALRSTVIPLGEIYKLLQSIKPSRNETGQRKSCIIQNGRLVSLTYFICFYFVAKRWQLMDEARTETKGKQGSQSYNYRLVSLNLYQQNVPDGKRQMSDWIIVKRRHQSSLCHFRIPHSPKISPDNSFRLRTCSAFVIVRKLLLLRQWARMRWWSPDLGLRYLEFCLSKQ